MPGKRWRRKFGGNPNELYLCSRSSGSQLAGCVIVTEWEKIDLPRNAQCGEIANEFLSEPIGPENATAVTIPESFLLRADEVIE